MYFVLSKLFSFLVSPLTYIIGLLLLALWFNKRKSLRIVCVIGAVGLFLFFTNSFHYKVKESLTRDYIQNIDTAMSYKYGVVLGAGVTMNLELDRCEWDKRVMAALELYRKGIIRKIIYTGAISEPRDRKADQPFRRKMINIGVVNDDFILEPLARNTKEHPIYLKEMMGSRLPVNDFVIISSALLLRRALHIFENEGLYPLYYGVDIPKYPYRWNLQSLLPQLDLLNSWSGIIHEQIGQLVNYNSMDNKIWLSLAHMGGNEQKYIQEAFDTNWVVPLGPNVNGLESDLEKFLGGDHSVVALSAGTAAIHLALVQLGVKQGDEVICQSFTFSASANPITYQGANPVFVDSESNTWNMSPTLLEEAILDRKEKTGKYPKAIIPVHLYGMPSKMDQIMEIANRYGIPVVEDAAEALGSTFDGRFCGTFGEFGVLSFNGNKIITTSGGGALVCSTKEEAQRTMFFATQARDNAPHYQHTHIGYNYRMSNICAGIGRGQIEVLPSRVERRRSINNLYRRGLEGVNGITFQDEPDGRYRSNFWLTSILIDPSKAGGVTREDVRLACESANIETRPLWKPMHLQPIFVNAPFYGDGTSEGLFNDGLCLPSGSILTDEQILRVVEVVKDSLSKS